MPGADAPVAERPSRRLAGIAFAFVAVASLLGACKHPPPPAPEPAPSAAPQPRSSGPASSPSSATHVSTAPGDPAKGKKLAERFECSRCHDGSEIAAAPLEKHCVHCHQAILAGRFAAGSPKLGQWKKTVARYRDVPSLATIGSRLRAEWIEGFLLEPHDLRPAMVSSMPRLRITRDEAHDVAAWLAKAADAPVAVSLDDASAESGRRLIEQKGCGSCHVMTGVAKLPTAPDAATADERTRRAISLSPDLRHVRERIEPARLVAWLRDPLKVKPDTLMPAPGLTDAEVRDVAKYLLTAELAPPEVVAVPARLPVLDRKVTWDEVDKRVFHVTCRHCHGEPDFSLGDGGPGNTGGFGFAPRGVSFASYEGAASGWLDEKGERHSLYKPDAAPRLLMTLVARQNEEAGKSDPDLRGMPLGLPAVSAEDVQILESWIAQGRPR